MYTDNGKKTIYDDVKPRKMVSVDIPEFNEIKTDNHFKIKNISLDNDLETYNTTSFPKFDFVQDNELFNLWGFGDVEMMSLNPEYKYKYPKLTKSELIKQEWQTQEGIPNRLNQFLRAEESGASIQEIKQLDDEYQLGLNELYTQIDKEVDLINNTLKSDGENDARLTEANKNDLKERETKLKEDRKRLGHLYKRYNPVKIKPALTKTQYIDKVGREVDLVKSIKNEPVYLKNVKEPVIKTPIAQQYALQRDIKNGKALKSISKAQQPPIPRNAPSSDLPTDKIPDELTPDQIEKNKEEFKKAISEGKEKLKNKKVEKYNEEKANRYQNLVKKYNEEKENRYKDLQNEYQEESRKQVAHENLVLKGYDEVIGKLENLSTQKLSKTEREEINEMLKKIDGTNIGAINQVETAIKRLKSKQEKIEEHKTKILDKIKKQEAERKAPRRVSRSSNIMQMSDLPKNDDASDFSVKKRDKSRPHFSGLAPAEPKTPSKK